MSEKVEVVRVVCDGATYSVESKNPDGTIDTTPLGSNVKAVKRMAGRTRQFFYASRAGDTWRLRAYAPYQPW